MPDILNAYRRLVSAEELRPDPEQAAAAARLEQLATELETPRKTGLFARLTGKARACPKGVYLWGDVGRGKSMLMDLFFDHVAVEAKRRVHFAEFMLEVHARIATERAKQAGDPIAPVAAALAEEVRLLAFDEMMVTNSPDAMILSRLFTALIEEWGDDRHHLQPAPQGPLQERAQPRAFPALHRADRGAAGRAGAQRPTDYRRDRLGRLDTWLVPNGPKATMTLSAAFFRLTDYPVEDAAHVPSET